MDLIMLRQGDRFLTKTYFKKTGRNVYPRGKSHPLWLKANLQFRSMRQNCSDVKYFVVQADLLKQRFLQKEYKEVLLDQEIKEVLNI